MHTSLLNCIKFITFLLRGVQYVHWVMHKCIMVKVGGKQNTQKVCKKQVNFSKTEGKLFKVGEQIIFAKQGENLLTQGKWGGIRNLLSTTKKKVTINFG